MTVDFKDIYNRRAADYDLLISREDYLGNLLPSIVEIVPLGESVVVELGTGTGRFARLIKPHIRFVAAFDISPHMLEMARIRLSELPGDNWSLAAADHRHLPLTKGIADLVLVGWSLGHFVGWYRPNYLQEITAALNQIERILRPDGTVIIVETLGTGTTVPKPPSPDLRVYYDFLEKERGFSSKWIRTDYAFASEAEAMRLTEFFFGEEMLKRISTGKGIHLPECTGIWWKRGINIGI